MPVRVLGADGTGTLADVIAGYGYAARNGADVVNASLGGGGFSQAEEDAIREASGVLFVVAAGNDTNDNDANPDYPCAHDLENVVCVAATDRDDHLASFSNYGAASVDLAAPGVDIASTYTRSSDPTQCDGYCFLSGTSMASPHTAGVAALILGETPGASVADLRRALLGGVERKAGLIGRTVTGGRLNARLALDVAAGRAEPLAPPPPGSTAPAAPAPAPVPAPAPLAPAPAALPAPPVDSSPPGLSVSFRPTQRRASVLRGGLQALVGCTEACRIDTEVRVSPRDARRLHLGTRTTVIGRATRSLEPGRRWTVAVRLSARARRAVGRVSSVAVSLPVRASDAAGNSRTVTRRVTIRR